MKVLIFGLANTGKSYLSTRLKSAFADKRVAYFNADEIREKYNDWDFSDEGRKRQAQRAVDFGKQDVDLIMWDFICPFQSARDALGADLVIWMNTNQSSKYKDTDAVFERPEHCDIEVTDKDWWTDDVTQETVGKIIRTIAA
jgi:adenylylsulfate kinase